MFRIGEFSRLAMVSIRMLRHYDEIGLLTPVTGITVPVSLALSAASSFCAKWGFPWGKSKSCSMICSS